MAGWFFGTSGKSLEKNGPTILDKNLMAPAFSPILMKTKEKRHDTNEFDRKVNTIAGGFENSINNQLENHGVVEKSPFDESNKEGDKKK
jgi:hypothetical protein